MTNKIKNTFFIEEKLTLTTEWDKTFAKSSLVSPWRRICMSRKTLRENFPLLQLQDLLER